MRFGCSVRRGGRCCGRGHSRRGSQRGFVHVLMCLPSACIFCNDIGTCV